MILEVRGSQPEEVDATLECCARAFSNGDAMETQRKREFFKNIHTNDPSFTPEHSRVVVQNGQVLSAAHVFERRMLIDGVPIKLGGIGSVATLPEFRGRGYSTNVLGDAITYMVDEGYELSLLSTGLTKFYERLGWHSFLYHREDIVELPERVHVPQSAYTIRPVDWEHDLAEIEQIHTQFNKDATGPLLRTNSYWKALPSWRPFDLNQLMVAATKTQVVAYLMYDDQFDRIQEFGVLENHTSALVDLILEALRKAKSVGKKCVQSVPLFPVRHVLAAKRFVIKSVLVDRLMFRWIDLPKIIEKLRPRMEARLMASDVADWRGELRLGDSHSEHEIDLLIRRGRIKQANPISSIRPTIDIKLPPTDLLGLLFGQTESPQLLWNFGVTDLTVPIDKAEALLKALFPRRVFRWFLWDKF
ncbi:MAG: GNAT family N-acetyltransferase [Candidatus Poribacteria bacterium]|nr:GNAT family N-acetyltransferase [Candidatus Poribacteria bacterium]